MALNGLFCADVPLRNYSVTYSLFDAASSVLFSTWCIVLIRNICVNVSADVSKLIQYHVIFQAFTADIKSHDADLTSVSAAAHGFISHVQVTRQ